MGSLLSLYTSAGNNSVVESNNELNHLKSYYADFHSHRDWSNFNLLYMNYLEVHKSISFEDFSDLVDILETRKDMYLFFIGSHIYPITGMEKESEYLYFSKYFTQKIERAIYRNYSDNVDFLLRAGGNKLISSVRFHNIHRCPLLIEYFHENNASHLLIQ